MGRIVIRLDIAALGRHRLPSFRSTRAPTATPLLRRVCKARPTVCLGGLLPYPHEGWPPAFFRVSGSQAIRLPVRIEIPCVALKNTLDVTSAVQDTDNFDRVRQSMIENDVAAKGKTLHPRS